MLEAENQYANGRVVKKRHCRRSGFTLVELSFAMVIMVVALVSVSAATLQSHSLRRTNRERVLANNAVRSIAERIHSLSYRTIEQSPDDWVQEIVDTYGPGGTVGNTFNVDELNPPLGAATVGAITIITDETTTDADVSANLGLPRDLNGDLDATDTDVTGDARLLPIVITLNYRSGAGTSSITHAFFAVGF
ncbi:MAG: prepilin-type N-terminal cleavage/methylation domain-containing protein [Planctomycetota bacterium]|jgi:prepilin-type N-terminal cleavage/methylation domain-containing protein